LDCQLSMKITGIFTIQDGISLGYPFLEAISSAMPIVDEFLINDAGSKDGTFDNLQRLKELFPDKVSIYQIPSFQSKYFEWIDEVLNRLIEEASGDWIIEVQGDEIRHEKDIFQIKKILEKAKGYNSLRQRCLDCSWQSIDSYVYKVVRIFRNIPGVESFLGGDDFRLKGAPPQEKKYTTHNVPPELEIDIPFYHFPGVFPKNNIKRYERIATYVATGCRVRREIWERLKQIQQSNQNWENWKPPEKILSCFPALFQGLNKYSEYTVREELFDKKWLSKVTGLKY